MLTAKENMREAIRGGNPDRFVNQFEGISLLMHPYMMTQPLLKRGMENVVNGWGVTNSFPENVPGAFPVHTPDKIVVKDIEQWQDYVHAPSLKFSDELWNICKDMYAAVDGTKAYKAAFRGTRPVRAVPPPVLHAGSSDELHGVPPMRCTTSSST